MDSSSSSSLSYKRNRSDRFMDAASKIAYQIYKREFQADYVRSASAQSNTSRYFALSEVNGKLRVETFLSRAAAAKHYKVNRKNISNWAAKNKRGSNLTINTRTMCIWIKESMPSTAYTLGDGEYERKILLNHENSASIYVTNVLR